MIKGFTQWINENSSDNELITRLDGLSYLHQSDSLDTTEYTNIARTLLIQVGAIPMEINSIAEVDDQDEPEGHWQNWAQNWIGPNEERIVKIIGDLDYRGSGNIKVELDTGIKLDIKFSREDGDKYKMLLLIDTGKKEFREIINNLMELDYEWSETPELISLILNWTINKYGYHAIDSQIDSLRSI